MIFWNRMNLQLFADGGAGTDGASGADMAEGKSSETGEDAAAAGQRRLRELGVPASRIKDRASRAVGRNIQAAQPKAQDAAAEAPKETTEEPTNQDGKLSFKELLAQNPEYNEAVQAIIRERLKGSRDAQEKLDKLAPALEVLARQHKLDPENLDYDALAQAVNNDDHYYEETALEHGRDIATEKREDQQQRQQAREQRTLQEQMYAQHFQKLEQQGEAMKAVFPGFDLQTELQNPAFARMTHPAVGISVEDAYYAVHRAEIQAAAMQVTAQTTARKIANSIASGQARPAEAGQASQAPSVAAFDYRNASREQRDALKQRIRQAAARGEKLYPGQ